MIVKMNEEKNGVELHFPAAPSQQVLDLLRADRAWRYHRQGKYWYAKRNPQTVAFAEALEAGETPPASTGAVASSRPAQRPEKPAYEMRYVFSGYRDKRGEYTKGSYSLCMNGTDGANAYCLEFLSDSYGNIPTPAGAVFINDSDGMSDYFERSRWIIDPSCPDFLGVLEAWEKRQEHDKKRFAKRYPEETKDQKIRQKMRMGYSWEKAEQLVEKDEQDRQDHEREVFAYVAEARRLAVLFRDARASGDEQSLERAKMELEASTSAYRRRKREEQESSTRRMNLKRIEDAKARGECVELSGVAFLLTACNYQVVFTGEHGTTYGLTAIDAVTGEKIYWNEFTSPEDRQKKMVEIVNSRTSAAG